MMDIKKFKKLQNSIEDQDFNSSYGNINKVLLAFSYFGNIASIFLAYFFVSKILSGAISNQIFVSISSVFILTCVELIKRSIFDKFSFQYVKNKEFAHKDVLPLIIGSLCVVSISFYSSVSGAREFSNKSTQIQTNTDAQIKLYSDSVTAVYNKQISSIDSEINANKQKFDDKDKEETFIESSNQYLSPAQRGRIRDLKQEKSDINTYINIDKSDMRKAKIDLKNDIDQYTRDFNDKANQNKDENNTNSILFVAISTLIELSILMGIYFNEYFKYRSYSEYKSKLENDPNYQKWISYNSILEAIYTSDTKVNDKLTSIKNIVELCRMKGVNVIQKDADEFIKMMISLGILKSIGRNVKYFAKTKDSAFETLKMHFMVE